MKIGVLALQGAVAEHMNMLQEAGVETIPVKKVEQLNELSGLIIPGGESTAIGKLMHAYGFMDKLKELGQKGFPLFGTCAGMIILAEHIVGQEKVHLGLMKIKVERNAFGRQRESFETDLEIKGIAEDFRAVFIRAPLITEVGPEVEVLSVHQNQIVAARQANYLAASFHPELTKDSRLHQYFVLMAQSYQEMDTDSRDS